MMQNIADRGITLKEAAIESPGTIIIVESYQDPLRDPLESIKKYYGTKISSKQYLKLYVYAVNSTTGRECSCSIPLVYGTITRSTRSSPFPAQLIILEII